MSVTARRFTSGPMSVSSSSGSPIFTCRYAAISASVIRAAMPRCRNSRRVVVQRCPAVPTAPNSTARSARSRLASSITINAVVAAQFENRAAQPARHGFRDAPAHFGRSREAYQRNPPVVHQRLADRIARADHQIENALEIVPLQHAVADFLHRDRRQRRFRRRPPQHAIPAHRRDHRVPRPHGHRKIERADHAHDAQRMPLLIHPMARPLAVHGESVKLARKPDGEIGDIDHLLHFAQAFGQNLAHFERNQRAQIALVQRAVRSRSRARSRRAAAPGPCATRGTLPPRAPSRTRNRPCPPFSLWRAIRPLPDSSNPTRRRWDWESSRHSRRRNSPAQYAVFLECRGLVRWRCAHSYYVR